MSVHWMTNNSSSRSHNGGGLLPTPPRAPLGMNAGNPRPHLPLNPTFPPHTIRGAPGGKGGLLDTPRNASGRIIPPLTGSLLGNDFVRHEVPQRRAGRGLLPTPGTSPGLIPTPPDNENLNPMARGPGRSMPINYTDNVLPNSASRGGRPLLPSPPTPPENFDLPHKESSVGLLPTPGSGFLGNDSFHPAGRGVSVGLLPTPGGGGRPRGGLLPTPPGPGIGGGVGPGIGPHGVNIGQLGLARGQSGLGRGQPGLGRGLLDFGRGPPGLAMGRGMPGMGIRPCLGRGNPGMGRGNLGLGRGMPGITEAAAATGLLNLVQVLNMGRGNHRGGWVGNRPPLKMKRLSLGIQPQFDYKKNNEQKRNYVKSDSSSIQKEDFMSKENNTEEERLNENNENESEWCANETEDNSMIMQNYEEENSSGEGEFGLDGVDFGSVYEALETGTQEQSTEESIEYNQGSDLLPRTMTMRDNECFESEVSPEAGTRRSWL